MPHVFPEQVLFGRTLRFSVLLRHLQLCSSPVGAYYEVWSITASSELEGLVLVAPTPHFWYWISRYLVSTYH